jgi:hypothetical protein
MKIENFNLVSDKDIYNKIPHKEINSIVQHFINNKKINIFNEKITFKLKNSNIGLINSIRHACYKIDEVYYLDADFNDIKLISEDNIYIQNKYILNRLKSIPIKQDDKLKQFVDKNIGSLVFETNRTEQYSDITTEHFKFNSKDINIITNYFRLYQLIYSKSKLTINNIHLRIGYNHNDCTFSTIHTFSINTPDTDESSSSAEFHDFDVMICTNGTINFFIFINNIIDKIINRFNKQFITIKDDNDKLLSILFENENYIFENLLLEYSYLNNFSPIITIKDNNLYIKNLSEKNLLIVIKNIINDLNEFKTLINKFNK